MIESAKVTVGKHYFFSKSRRTDQFAHKRYTTPELEKWETIYVQGRVISQQGNEAKVVVVDTGMQAPDPQDGATLVFDIGCAICVTGGDLRTLEDHGKPNLVLGKWIAK